MDRCEKQDNTSEHVYTARCFGCSWATHLTLDDLLARAKAHYRLIDWTGTVIAIDLDTNRLVSISSVVTRAGRPSMPEPAACCHCEEPATRATQGREHIHKDTVLKVLRGGVA